MTMAFLASNPDLPRPAPASGEIDAATLREAQGGDARALERFIRHYERSIFAFLSRSIGRGPEVEDMAQEVFVRAYRALPRFEKRSEARVSTWLLQIAVRLVLDRRKRKRVPVQSLDERHMATDARTPETERRHNELVQILERTAAELPDEQRVAFILADFHGLDTEQIAAVTETQFATVKTRLFRAREHMKQVLTELAKGE